MIYKYKNKIVEKYHKILCKNFPEFLYDYIQTDAMQRIGKIGCNCGTEYTKIFNSNFLYSNLEHSIGVALIVWNFTHDKKQTLAGLFHDISTPVFKHCIDVLNGDAMHQEWAEGLTEKMIQESKQIMDLLQRDGISIEEVKDYHQYPIADNDTPKLSADRLEYTLAAGLYFKQHTEQVWTLEEIKQIYQDIEVQKNEDGIEELGFKTIKIAEKFVEGASKLWRCWSSNEDKITMQFIADVVKKMSDDHLLTLKDLYTLPEIEVVQKIENCGNEKIENCFKKFRELDYIGESDNQVENKYCIHMNTKQRYIVPLVANQNAYIRADKISKSANMSIQQFLLYSPKKYAYLDFNF